MKLKTKPFPEYADVMAASEFIAAVNDGFFIPYDGDGYWSTEEGMTEASVWNGGRKPEWATHVVWFNR